MPHDGERKGVFGAVNLLTGEVGERVRQIMERGMVANRSRLSDDHVSKLIAFTPYSGIEGGPLSLIRSAGAQWWPGWMIASDSSPVEAGMGENTDWYTSNRVLLSTVVALGLNAQGVKASSDEIERSGSVDPDWSSTSLRESGVGEQGSGQIFLVLPGNGILYVHEGSTALPESESVGFCHAMEEMLRSNATWKPDRTLWKTYMRLLRDWKPKDGQIGRAKIMYGHQEDAWGYFEEDPNGLTRGLLKSCPACRKAIIGGQYIHEAPDIASLSAAGTFFSCPQCETQTRLMDACGLTYLYRPDQSNLHVMNSFSVFVEHLLLYSWCEQFSSSRVWKKDHQAQYEELTEAPIFIMDGPLALYGSCGRFVSAFRKKVQEAVGKGATVFGIVKTGRIRDFLDSLPETLRGGKASYFVVPDRVRYEMIDVNNKQPGHYGFGETSYYGNDVIVRTRRGLRFVLSVATPEVCPKWWIQDQVKDSLDHKAGVIEEALINAVPAPPSFDARKPWDFDTQDAWMDYLRVSSPRVLAAPLWRAISTLEHVESLMFQQSSIPQVFAHMLAGTQATLIRSFLRTMGKPGAGPTKEDESALDNGATEDVVPPRRPSI